MQSNDTNLRTSTRTQNIDNHPSRDAELTKLVCSLLALPPEQRRLFIDGVKAVEAGTDPEEAFTAFKGVQQ